MPDSIWTDAGMRGELPQEYVKQLSADQKQIRGWLTGDFEPQPVKLHFGARSGGKAVNPHAKMHAPVITNPIPCAICTLGVGCEEAGMCYADSITRVAREKIRSAMAQMNMHCEWDNWKPNRDM